MITMLSWLQVVEGGHAEVKIKRLNIAERLYRITGGGVYLYQEGTTTAWKDFHADQQKEEAVNDAFGPGKCLVVSGTQGAVRKTVSITLYEAFPAARAVFDQADQITGLPLTKLCFEGPEDELARTDVCQPAIFTVSSLTSILASPPSLPAA